MRNPFKYYFPGSTIRVAGPDGHTQGVEHLGVTVEIHFEGKLCPPRAEVYGVYQGEADEPYGEIGLEWDGTTLTGYDGVFELPTEVIRVLKRLGFKMGEGIEG